MIRTAFSCLAALSLFLGGAYGQAVVRRQSIFTLRFEPSADGSFVARGSGYRAAFAPDGASLFLQTPREKRASERKPGNTVRMTLVGADAKAPRTLLDAAGSVSNYYSGSDPAQWRVGVPNYGRLRFAAVYPGIDVVYYGSGGKLEYDFVVHPGSDPKRIRLAYAGVDSLRISDDGNLVVSVAGHELVQRKAVVYQDTESGRDEIPAAYRIDGREVRMEVGEYDSGSTLIIDPVVVYSTYFGGSGANRALVLLAAAGDGARRLPGPAANRGRRGVRTVVPDPTCRPTRVADRQSGNSARRLLSFRPMSAAGLHHRLRGLPASFPITQEADSRLSIHHAQTHNCSSPWGVPERTLHLAQGPARSRG